MGPKVRDASQRGLSRGPRGQLISERLTQMEDDLDWLLKILDYDSEYAPVLDPWGDDRAYIYTARDAIRRVRARLNEANCTEEIPPREEVDAPPERKTIP